MDSIAIVKIVGEPWLGRARAYREQMEAWVQAYRDYAAPLGATGLPGAFPGHRMSGLFFYKNAQPAGWSKTNAKGFSSPKRGSVAAEEFKRLPPKPASDFVFGDAIVNNLSYDMPCGGYGTGGIAMAIEDVSIGWIGDDIVARIPHAGRAAAAHLARHPDHTIRHGAADWRLPPGVIEISQAELDLMDAQHRVRFEQARKAEAA